ncbi:MAG TPA: hypothetical protein VNF71_08715 [Acidimicrobiales bacterium]|nr:hypothetical protein [Acidimicrobiales bacterium]
MNRRAVNRERRLPRARIVLAIVATAAAIAWAAVPARAAGTDPTSSDPLGPLVDVTANWQAYQPSSDFCVHPTVFEVPATTETATGSSPACAASGFAPSATGLYEVKIDTPPLCTGCRRLFIDYSEIAPSTSTAPTSHGHAYFRLMSLNPTYTVPPLAHSPNIKNLTNDRLVAPPGSPVSALTSQVDPYDMAYAADTANFAHTAAQGPYYVGPGYLNTAGQWVQGAYLDVDMSKATELPQAEANLIRYAAGFDSSPSTCPDSAVFGPTYTDGNYFYGGCVNAFGASTQPGVDPWASS